MLDPKLSRVRQKRLLEALSEQKLDAVALGLGRDVYYLSGHLPNWLHSCGLVVLKDGTSWLTAANKPLENAAVDEGTSFEAQWMATLRQEQPAVVAGQMGEFLKKHRVKRVGVDSSDVTLQLATSGAFEVQAIDEALFQLRRRKDSDELALIERAMGCAAAMYRRAREIVKPGVMELDVYNELHAAAVREAGEPMSAVLGNDFTCGGGGGPPRKGRAAEAGELYILDVGPSYHGYFADVCRTFAVSEISAEQREAGEQVKSCFEVIERLAKPGASCREIYGAVTEHLTRVAGRSFGHHLGHGIGLQPHEFPHLNPKWDDVLMEGEVFAAEPALYGEGLRGGIRIENDYVVTKDGVKRLLDSPMDL
jgi:Xaa-Pro aminopeptidase